MARSVIGCQGAAGAGRTWALMQQRSRGTGQLQVSPLESWDQRCHCDCSWAHACQRRIKQNRVRASPDSTHPSPERQAQGSQPFAQGVLGGLLGALQPGSGR